MDKLSLARVLATSFLAGEPDADLMIARGSQTLGRPWRWLKPLAVRLSESFANKTRPRHRHAVQLILQDPAFVRAWSRFAHRLTIEHWVAEPQRMLPVAATSGFDLPTIASARELADWLWLDDSQLEWFADLKGLGYKQSETSTRHYHYRVLAKRPGSVRLIEAPKARLKKVQGQILTELLDKIPPHPVAHGFVKGRSIKTFAAPHVGQQVLLRIDLRDFFVSIRRARIQALFRTLGYPESVADLLGGMCTSATPRQIWNAYATEIEPLEFESVRALHANPHLPQGAPTSPALANLCAYRFDCRLTGLASAAGATYTRYADDLAFSGDEIFVKDVGRFATHVASILLEEGFDVNHRKTRVMRSGVRQHIAGVVTNGKLNVMRSDFDRLKATLTNCARNGPQTQNRNAHPNFRSHLNGRVGFVEMVNPKRGKKLRSIFDQIEWP